MVSKLSNGSTVRIAYNGTQAHSYIELDNFEYSIEYINYIKFYSNKSYLKFVNGVFNYHAVEKYFNYHDNEYYECINLMKKEIREIKLNKLLYNE